MSDLPVDPLFLQYPRELRASAESLLKNGPKPASLGYVLSQDTLAVLFKLASTADSAGDGLKLLHELQTHQIELDLQHEQNTIIERETAEELAHYKALYQFAPVGYLVINSDGRILECNKAGSDLLGVACNDLNGEVFESLLTADSRPVFNWKLKKLFNGAPDETCTVQINNPPDSFNHATPTLRVFAMLAPTGDVVLLNLSAPERPPSE